MPLIKIPPQTRKRQIVSIAYEPGSTPIVELFWPTHDMKDRRIPRLEYGIASRKEWKDTDEAEQKRVLHSLAIDLEKKEEAFLRLD